MFYLKSLIFLRNTRRLFRLFVRVKPITTTNFVNIAILFDLISFKELMFSVTLPEYEKSILNTFTDDDQEQVVFMSETDTTIKPILDQLVKINILYL